MRHYIIAVITIVLCSLSISMTLACPCNSVKVPDGQAVDVQKGIAFGSSNQYAKEVSQAIAAAKAACLMHKGEHDVAVVSDIDETIFDNREEYRDRPEDISTDHRDWIMEARAPLIRQTADFLLWARENGFAIFLVSGRTEEKRKATIENLVKDGVVYDGLLLRQNMQAKRAEDAKVEMRKQIEEMGFRIIVNIGDQWSDLAGGHAEDCEKLPNRIYFIR